MFQGRPKRTRKDPERLPWDDLLAVALGILAWTPRTFWEATVPEYAAAVRGKRAMNGDASSTLRPREMSALQRELEDAPEQVVSIHGN